jgi:mono/diheme cytochrome c family protein
MSFVKNSPVPGGKLSAVLIALLLPFGLSPLAAALPVAATRPIEFTKDVKPIFAKNCYSCHGAKKQESGLRLDEEATALKGGDSFGKSAIVPSKSAESVLIQAVAHSHSELKMPKKGNRLTDGQVGILRAWIDQGANWPAVSIAGEKEASKEHWAFKAPVRPALPAVKNSKWVRNPVDAFILAKLEKEKLKPSPPAEKAALLRRLSLDLIGLPPTLDELDAFLADKSPDAWPKQVERLLASPHYGERWGRLWLDAARYADSDGYEKDKRRLVHFYRDWVIAAFNRDLPYDRFIIEQLAGDQLPGAAQDQFVATGFLRNSMLNEEGGIHPEQFRMEAMFDRMDAVGKGILGLTTACAQCHNHKYDPLTQEEYYRMFAFLNNDHEAMPRVFTTTEQEKIASLRREMNAVEAAMKQQIPDCRARMAEWEAEVAHNQPQWTTLRDLELISDNNQRYYPQSDGSLLAAGWAPTKFTATFQTTNQLENISAIRLELFTDPNLPANGPGRSYKGLFALTEFAVEAAPLGDPKKKSKVNFASATADFDQTVLPLEPGFHDGTTNKRVTGPINFAMDGDKKTAWGGDSGPGQRNTDRVAVFQLATNISYSGGTVLTLNLSQEHGSQNANDFGTQNLGRFRVSVISTGQPVVADKVPKKVREVLAVPTAKRTEEQVAMVFDYWRTTVSEFTKANAKLDAL